MSRNLILTLIAVAEFLIIGTALLLALFIFPDEKGGLNLVIFLPAVLLSSMIASSIVLMTTLKNKAK